MQRLSCVPLLSEQERKQALIEWNDTAVDYPQGLNVQQLVEERAARAPHSVALISGDQYLTYSELNLRANKVAHCLRRMGVGPEALVAVLIERSIDLTVALLGVLKAGGAYIALEPANPKYRLALMLDGLDVPALITQQSLRADLPEFEWKLICCLHFRLDRQTQRGPDKSQGFD
jgi:non-ribosomal peptide synthetase component F